MSTAAALTASRAELLHRPKRSRLLQWVPTDNDQLALAEERMLAPIAGTFQQKMIAGLNTIFSTNPAHKKTLLLLHGFAGGLGVWVPNWHALTEKYNVYAIDLPGFARSERTPRKFESETHAISYMTDHLTEWFSAAEIDTPVALVGHSFGGYVAANFAVKYPQRVCNLLLADPWGVPEAVHHELPWKWKLLRWMFYHSNPLSILRAAGPWGPDLMPKVRKDFAERWQPYHADPYVFYDYIYHCNAGHPTGEQAFQACCTGNIYAKLALAQVLPEGLDPGTPLTILYGAKTWMDADAGRKVVQEFRSRHSTARAAVHLIPEAGHQLNSDNPDGFNRAAIAALDESDHSLQ